MSGCILHSHTRLARLDINYCRQRSLDWAALILWPIKIPSSFVVHVSLGTLFPRTVSFPSEVISDHILINLLHVLITRLSFSRSHLVAPFASSILIFLCCSPTQSQYPSSCFLHVYHFMPSLTPLLKSSRCQLMLDDVPLPVTVPTTFPNTSKTISC